MIKKRWMRTIGKQIDFDYFADNANVAAELLKRGWVQAPDEVVQEDKIVKDIEASATDQQILQDDVAATKKRTKRKK